MDAEEFMARRRTLLQGDLEVLSELSFMESDGDEFDNLLAG